MLQRTIRDHYSQHSLRALKILLLGAVGFFINQFHFSLMFGVDVLFGNIVTMIAVIWFGTWPGALVAALTALPTLFLWNHPYYFITCICEAIFVGVSMRLFWGRALLAATSFWLVPACLLIFFFYHVQMDLSVQSTVLLWLKQSINGIFCMLVANGLLMAVLFFGKSRQRAILSFDTSLFNTLVAMVFIPSVLVLVYTSRSRLRELEREVVSSASHLGSSVGTLVESWARTRMNLLFEISRMMEQPGQSRPESVQKSIEIISNSFVGFQSLFVTDPMGTAIAHIPTTTLKGLPTIGRDYGDMEYFSHIKTTLEPRITGVQIGRVTTEQAIVGFAVPIIHEGKFNGIVNGTSLATSLRETLLRYTAGRNIVVTIIDSNNNIVVSSSENIEPLMHRETVFQGEMLNRSKHVYIRQPEAQQFVPPLLLWSRSSFGFKQLLEKPKWEIVVEVPIATHMNDLEVYYIENFSLIIGLCVSGLFFSVLASRLVTAPIGKLASTTTDLASRVEDSATIDWPSSRLVEIDSLIANFKNMTAALGNRFKELRVEVLERTRAQEHLKAASLAAESASQAKSAFLANMSHEIRTPLSAVIGYSEILAQPNLSHAEREAAMKAIVRNGDQLQSLIDDVLDFSKVEAGELRIENRWTSLDEILSGGIETLETTAKEKKLDLLIIATTPLPSGFETDPTRLRQILLNLVGNAVKFTTEGHVKVSVSFEKEPQTKYGFLRFVVEDTGVGISAEDSEKLFKPFVQADVSMKRRFGGTGLGLVLSRRLARALGGEVSLSDCQSKVGCTFVAVVKVGIRDSGAGMFATLHEARQAGSLQTRSPEQPFAAVPRLHGQNILLVEDSKDVRFLVGTVLRKLGAIVEEAGSGAEGIEKALRNTFDVILMDVQMPEMDGVEAVQRLRAQHYKGRIIALTAHALSEHRERCLQAGFNAYLTKPVNFQQLAEIILQQ